MNLKKLPQHCDLINERNKLIKRIKKLEQQSNMVADVVQNGYKGHAIIFGFDEKRSNKLKELKDILVEREAKIIIEQVEIEKYISTINRSDIRQIFEYKYIDNMNWIQVQIAMGYDTEDVARKKHDRFLKKI